ncbi:DMT family transporter [Pelobacter seleniigenes]|uniref:DMT family transporter n=1 Tax=Pelobacter seleniigenes TaxID=407188 RepID=UPI000691C179|nr:DMT family transporter [Pelobacter seleniigenes]
MDRNAFRADLLLLLTAAIWGFAFVAQRVGMDHVGPFTYNGIRFAIGSLSLLPLIILTKRKEPAAIPGGDARAILVGGLMAGIILFAGASLQQAGLVYTTAGNAGFITGLYVVIVPLLGLFWKQNPGAGTWIGAILAAVGLYFLSVSDGLSSISFGDLLVLLSAFFWAGHVLLIGWLAPKMNSLKLASAQFAICALFSLLVAAGTEVISWAGILRATLPILYGGLFSVGIAYTLQVVAQRHAHPAHSAILLSLEGAFAALGGWLLLDEVLTGRALLGCALMLGGMLLSELSGYLFKNGNKNSPFKETPTP